MTGQEPRNKLTDYWQEHDIKLNTRSCSASGQIGGNTVPGLWLLGMNKRVMERQRKSVFHVDLNACNAYARVPDSLSSIAAPLLIVAGR